MSDGTDPIEPAAPGAVPPPGAVPQPGAVPPPGVVPPPGAVPDDPGDDAPAPTDPGDVALLGLIDRLAALLDRSELTELEVQVGATGLVLRKPAAIAPPPPAIAGVSGVAAASAGHATEAAGAAGTPGADSTVPSRPSVKAPLTGIWYGSPSPGTAPYVTVGGEVGVGQVIGLIEAMKLFNEIKSDLTGRVVRIHAENGKLVKARQPLIEVEPL
ncbi:MAG TPA: biotin/lipoyl-containing protein [Candidatus Limnocylindrales bacterium]|nr:biotin/lipoyl-containing protein [Candidatus Limnocylindrales bacterium]